jgi:hypothetical protein
LRRDYSRPGGGIATGAAPGKVRSTVCLQGSIHHSSSSKSAGQAASSVTRSR